MRTSLRILLICVVVSPVVAMGEDHSPKAFNKTAYGHLKGMILRSAEKMPEENYAFKPAEGVRTFGQVLGHVADSQYYFCSAVLGEKNPAPKVEKTRSSKADLIASLKEAFAYCDKAYDGMTEESGKQIVKVFNDNEMPKLNVLTVNNMHTIEHYGNLVTYLRMKNIVPPSTEQPPVQPAKK